MTVTGFLVDVYCFRAKNVTDPAVMGSGSLTTYVSKYYSAFDHPPLSISVEQAQTIVHDAITYAGGLGFEPAAGFTDAAMHRGPRSAIGPPSASAGTVNRSISVPTTTRAISHFPSDACAIVRHRYSRERVT
ncbi:hypothetical protein [Streptomyces capitiformicae]|uniref:Uncharacterized protein n=1 Tax=Streptomyces capitiformicae TaxID=2014920 RepID=A0A919GFQ7_9ACTN|nr:hypothetical protein [Streptomyces capitiformicae]GHH83025.1 hypothetical protein GCM10017771_08800 [Streptomyces capitiformicae]